MAKDADPMGISLFSKGKTFLYQAAVVSSALGVDRPFTGRRMEPAAMGALCRSAAGTGTAASKPFLPASPLDGLHGHLSSPASRLGIVFSAGCRWNQGVPAGADWTKPFRLMEQPNLLFAAAQRDASYSGGFFAGSWTGRWMKQLETRNSVSIQALLSVGYVVLLALSTAYLIGAGPAALSNL